MPTAKEKVFNAMVSVVDETTKNVTDALKAAGMWDNSLFVWTSDNGAPVQVAGSNDPLKGGKATNWEGGTRVLGFVTGGLVPEAMRGKQLLGMVHICDWYSTLVSLATNSDGDGDGDGDGSIVSSPLLLVDAGPSPMDSIDQWPYLSGAVATAPRQSMVYEHRKFYNDTNNTAAVRRGKWKLIARHEMEADWFGHFSPNASFPTQGKAGMAKGQCSSAQPCLFDLEADPTEHNDVAPSNPAVAANLTAWVKELESEYHTPLKDPPMDIVGYCDSIKKLGGWSAPWRED
jgi:arylsulfatase I/J